jgi:hypothetical protein
MTRFVSALIRLCGAALLAAGLAAAQSSGTVTVRLPFEAIVAGRTMPAGDYQVQVLNTGSAMLTLLFRSGEASVLAPAQRIPWEAGEGAAQTMLVLHRTDQGIVLSKVLISGQAYYYHLQ